MGSGEAGFGNVKGEGMKEQRSFGAKVQKSIGAYALMLLCTYAPLSILSSTAHAAISIEVAEQKAKEAHDLASSDVIYQEQDFRALYFQNIQIIELLKEIRDEMKASNARQAKE